STTCQGVPVNPKASPKISFSFMLGLYPSRAVSAKNDLTDRIDPTHAQRRRPGGYGSAGKQPERLGRPKYCKLGWGLLPPRHAACRIGFMRKIHPGKGAI